MRTTYTTKSNARCSKRKGQSVYKVKGGYRLTKPKSKKKSTGRRKVRRKVGRKKRR